ncbi:MAG: universal stress protein [Pseudomonadota bacterium]
MKSIVVYADTSPSMTSRTEAALDLARAHKAHITFIVVTPYSSYVALDPMGGVFVANAALESIREEETRLDDMIKKEMANEDVSWEVLHYDGDAVDCVLSAARLADMIVVSLGHDPDNPKPHSLLEVADLAEHSGCPILAIPHDQTRFAALGSAAIAWNGSHEAANAVRSAIPMLQMAKTVHIITADKEPENYPSTALARYLSRHDINAEVHDVPAGSLSIEEAIESQVKSLGAEWMVMGAWGHSRLRQTLLGGTTRHFLSESKVPLLLAH